MKKGQDIQLAPGLGGWAYVKLPGSAGRLYVRFAAPPESSRRPEVKPRVGPLTTPMLKATEIHIDGEGSPVTAHFLRDLPLSAIEVLANSPAIQEALLAGMNDANWEIAPDALLSQFQLRIPSPGPTKLAPPTTQSFVRKDRPRLRRPSTRRISDEFLRTIAEIYLEALARGDRPLVVIQEEAQVPRGTAAKWVGMARDEGFLAQDPEAKERVKYRGVRTQ